MDGAGLIVSLACAAYETCQCAKQNKKDGIRIGDRLLNLVACAREWTAKSGDSSKKEETMRYLEDSLTKLNLVLQAHTLPQQQWTSKVKQFAKSRSIQDEITRCENQLDSALQDFQLRQHTALYIQNQDMFHELRDQMNQKFLQIFVLLEKQKLPSTTSQGLSGITYQEKKDEVLQGYHQDKAEHDTGATTTVPPLVYSSGSSVSTSSTGYKLSMGQCGSIGTKETEPSADIQDELKKLILDFSKLSCTFDREAFLGKGSFSKVYKGTYGGDGEEDNMVAIKRFRVTNIDVGQMTQSEKERHTRRFQSEAAMMSRCGLHQHIVQVVACHIDLNSNQLPLIVMERMETTLFSALHQGKIPSLKQRMNLLRGILGALEFLHIRGIVHQDVKSPNILLNVDSTLAKLSDFGEAKEKGFNTTQGMTNNMRTGGAASVGGVAIASGTPCYQPPEVLIENVTEASRNADIHAFGVVLWECLTGDIPHRNKRLLQILLLAQDESRSSLLSIPTSPNSTLDEIDKKVWETLRSLTESCLQRDRKQRPTASKLVQGWPFVDLEVSELRDNDDAEYELIHTLQTQLDSGDYGITNVPKRDIRLGPPVVLPTTAPSLDHRQIGGRGSTSPGDRPLKKRHPAGGSSHVGAVRFGKVDGAKQDIEDIEVNLAEAEAVAPVAAEEFVAAEQGHNNAAGNDTTADEATANKYREMVILVVTFYVIAAVVVGGLVSSKFGGR
ncbi:MAG: hypothetical protein SGBAC_009668 [Bacillariaceae sp.]